MGLFSYVKNLFTKKPYKLLSEPVSTTEISIIDTSSLEISRDLTDDEKQIKNKLYEEISSGDVNIDALPDSVLKVIDYMDSLVRELNEYQEKISVALKVIEGLPPDVEDIARKYYIDGHTWAYIEDETHYSHTSVMRKRRRILTIAYGLMPEEERRKLPKAI